MNMKFLSLISCPLRWRSLLLTAVLFAAACSSETETEPYLRVYPTSVIYDPESPDMNVVTVESNDLWNIAQGDPAPQTDRKSGSGDGLIHLTGAPEGRSFFTVSSGTAEYTVTVTRFGGDEPNPDPDPDPDPTPDPDPDPDPDPEPEPDPNPGTALFGKSWAEMPAELVKTGDYYYTYHMRADAGTIRNYTVCYSKKRMSPVWVAAPMHSSYKGSAKRTDAYGQDPTLGFTQAGKWSGYTRGHMLGSSDRTVSRETNKQVFYYSNIAPQMQSGFNTGGGAWNNLEDFTDGQWCADTLYQVIGCYWENENKKVGSTVIPTHYYKILLRTKKGNTRKSVAQCSADELKCAVFMVEHKSQKGLKPNASMMMSVSDLEKKTGFTYFPNVPHAPKNTFNPSDWGL